MFDDHSRCQSIEAVLRARIADLEAEIGSIRESVISSEERADRRYSDLLDRLLSITNPAALHQYSSARPAAPMPAVQRQPGQPGRGPMPIRSAAGSLRPSSPVLSPSTSAYRSPAPAVASELEPDPE